MQYPGKPTNMSLNPPLWPVTISISMVKKARLSSVARGLVEALKHSLKTGLPSKSEASMRVMQLPEIFVDQLARWLRWLLGFCSFTAQLSQPITHSFWPGCASPPNISAARGFIIVARWISSRVSVIELQKKIFIQTVISLNNLWYYPTNWIIIPTVILTNKLWKHWTNCKIIPTVISSYLLWYHRTYCDITIHTVISSYNLWYHPTNCDIISNYVTKQAVISSSQLWYHHTNYNINKPSDITVQTMISPNKLCCNHTNCAKRIP